ncbi:MAG: 30S ribosomal protein S12 methylthiotransferase RimO [Planctomycetota bacterium]|nr:30S ribosomal protein S12 methylthiotransferase RimO [Planctomycetota bacterium]
MPRQPKNITTVAFVSLGCPKNLVDSERMLGLLAEDGLVITPDHNQADVIVINTCGFLQAAKEESLREIRDAVALKHNGRCKRVIVAGCLVQREKTNLLHAVPQVDRLVGVFDREHIVDAVRGKENPRQDHGHFLGNYHDLSKKLAATLAMPSAGIKQTKTTRLPVFEDDRARLRLTPRHYAYLRISEGCNQACAFCTIPSIRGPIRSKPVEQILAEARELADDDAVELILIGQDTTSYGADIAYAPGLAGLLRTLDKQLDPHLRWLRLMYAYPSCFTDEMIRTIADSRRVLKYIDIPLQHINDEILTKMRRRVTRNQVETLLDKLRKWIPGIAIRTTFIAGTPGETDAQHQELVRFVRDFAFDMMGVFPYSRESSTPMARLDNQIPENLKQHRVHELMLTQQHLAFAKAKAMKGKTIHVLVDAAPKGASHHWIARSQSQAPEIDSTVLIKADHLHPGQFIDVKVTRSQAYDLIAEPAKKKSRSLTILES